MYDKYKLTKIIALDCEMVGIGRGCREDMLARVSIVNENLECVYDKYVTPRYKITDYRTRVSGIRPEDLLNGEDFYTIQEEVADILKGRILVGHSVDHDLECLELEHSFRYTRDTSEYRPFRAYKNGRTPSLKLLAKEVLDIIVQVGEHDSVEDARTVMRLYKTQAKKWEKKMSRLRK